MSGEVIPTMSRRAFLKVFGVTAGAAGAWVISSSIAQFLPEVHAYSIPKQIENSDLSNESKKMMSEIIKFRVSLGLEGLPAEVIPGLLKKDVWKPEQEDFTNLLPEKNKSYGIRIDELTRILFGKNSRRLVKGVRQDPSSPYGITFDTNARECLLDEDIHRIPIEKDFTDFVLHEAAGHGSDPSLNLPLPPDILIKTEYGKWMALSQCLSIEGQFLNHPNDLMFPLLKTSIGEKIGRTITENLNISGLMHEENTGIVNQEITKIARARGKSIEDLKFNKKACKEIGEVLISLLRSGQIKFTGSLKKVFTDGMEKVCVEIYAEMVKYAVMYPNLIGQNLNITMGIENVFSAIQERPVNIEVLRGLIKQPGKDVLDRYVLEKTFLAKRPNESADIQTLTEKQQERARQEQEDFQRRNKAFKDFLDRGHIPGSLDVHSDQIESVAKFAKLTSRIVNKYPMLKDTHIQQYDNLFDPNLHIWEIKEIERAMDTGFIRDLTADSNVSNHDLTQIINNNKILEKFVNSEAF